MICTAIKGQHDLIDKMKKNEDSTYPVVFSVGSVELDFNNVAQRVDEAISSLVEERAKELLNSQYGNLINELMDIHERIERQKEKIFKDDWELENDTENYIEIFGKEEFENMNISEEFH